MRSLKVAGIMLVVVALASIAMAGPNSMGIKDVSKVTFVAPIRVGTTLLPAGDYVVRHTMDGEEHIMVFQSENSKTPEVKVKCTLVRLAQKADHNQTVYSLDANNVRTLQELVFRGDTAKHVF
jgi:phage terminase large subunit GpA-like protein